MRLGSITGIALVAALIAAVGLPVAAVIAAVGLPVAGSQAAGKTVTLRNVAFFPKRLSIARNTLVTFSWRDNGTTHNVKSIGRKRFESISDRSMGSKKARLRSVGTYRYECTLHPGMTGRIVVR